MHTSLSVYNTARSEIIATAGFSQPLIDDPIKDKPSATNPPTATMSAGAKSTMSRDMEELTQGKEDISKKVQGHKANLSNPSRCPACPNGWPGI